MGHSDPWVNLVTHRGYSHSLLVLPLVALPLGWLAWRFLGKRGAPRDWIWLAFWALFTHPLLDFLTTYGTQLFLPLTDARYSLDTIGIIDLVYSIPLFVAVGYGLRKKIAPEARTKAARRALGFTSTYIVFHMVWSAWALHGFEQRLDAMGFEYVAARTPAPPLLFPLRHGVARDASGRIAVAAIAPWDSESYPIYIVDRPPSPRAQASLDSPRGEILRWFSDGYLTPDEQDDGTVVFQDHRYGGYIYPERSFFRWTLPAGAEPSEIQARRPSDASRDISLADEWNAAVDILFGTYPDRER